MPVFEYVDNSAPSTQPVVAAIPDPQGAISNFTAVTSDSITLTSDGVTLATTANNAQLVVIGSTRGLDTMVGLGTGDQLFTTGDTPSVSFVNNPANTSATPEFDTIVANSTGPNRFSDVIFNWHSGDIFQLIGFGGNPSSHLPGTLPAGVTEQGSFYGSVPSTFLNIALNGGTSNGTLWFYGVSPLQLTAANMTVSSAGDLVIHA